MLTSKRTRKVEIPGEEGEWALIKPASLSDLETAREVGLKALSEKFRQSKEVLDLLPNMDMSDAARDAKGDPYAGIDLPTLLSRCVVEWSYDGEITPEAIGDLDETTARFLAEQIYQPRETEAGKAVS